MHVEGRRMRDREDEIVISLEELSALVIHPRLSCEGAGHVGTTRALRIRSLVLTRDLHPVTTLPNQRRVLRMICHEPEERKLGFNAGEVRLCLRDDAAEILKYPAAGTDYLQDHRLERNPPESLPPRDPDSLEITLKRRSETSRI